MTTWQLLKLGDFLAKPPPQQEDLLKPDLLYRGGRLEIYGATKTGKSFLAQQLGLCLAGGVSWLGYEVGSAVRVLYLQGEVSEWGLYRRVKKVTEAMGVGNLPFWICTALTRVIGGMDDINSLAETIMPLGIEVVIVDPLYHFMLGSESSGEDTARFLRYLASLQAVSGVAIILVHHSRKTLMSQGVVMDGGFGEVKGSTNLVQWPDTIVRLVKVSKEVRELRWEGVRHGIEPPDKSLVFNSETCLFVPMDDSPQQVVMAILQDGEVSVGEVKKRLEEDTGLSTRQVDRVVARMIDRGLVERKGVKGDRRKATLQLTSKEER